MYEIRCEECGRIAFYASRTGAESRAERHDGSATDTGAEQNHDCDVRPMGS